MADIRTMIADDAYAMTFQSLGQYRSALLAALSSAPAAPQPAQPLDLSVMELAESVGLIGPASRTDDLHEAIQRFHDLIVANASIKAALHFADGLAQPARCPQCNYQHGHQIGCENNPVDIALKAQGSKDLP